MRMTTGGDLGKVSRIGRCKKWSPFTSVNLGHLNSLQNFTGIHYTIEGFIRASQILKCYLHMRTGQLALLNDHDLFIVVTIISIGLEVISSSLMILELLFMGIELSI